MPDKPFLNDPVEYIVAIHTDQAAIHITSTNEPKERIQSRVGFVTSYDWESPTSFATPCGYQFAVYDGGDIPLVDTACPCGKHWVVKWEML